MGPILQRCRRFFHFSGDWFWFKCAVLTTHAAMIWPSSIGFLSENIDDLHRLCFSAQSACPASKRCLRSVTDIKTSFFI
jgi:hypothetical protein